MRITEFKSIDELAEYYRNQLDTVDSSDPWRSTDDNVCDFILTYQYGFHVLEILKSNTNVPSKYDLLIIKNVSTRLVRTIVDESYRDVCKQILTIYKNRKV